MNKTVNRNGPCSCIVAPYSAGNAPKESATQQPVPGRQSEVIRALSTLGEARIRADKAVQVLQERIVSQLRTSEQPIAPDKVEGYDTQLGSAIGEAAAHINLLAQYLENITERCEL